MRLPSGLAEPYKLEYERDGKNFEVLFQPASIKQKPDSDQNYLAFFPTANEELVEEALRKILCDQHGGFHDTSGKQTFVFFTLRQIQKELKKMGKTRNIPQVKHALEVLTKTNLTLIEDGVEIYNNSILSDWIKVNREDYVSDPNKNNVARMPLALTESIDALAYRQFNYKRLCSCKYPLTRWLLRVFTHRYTFARADNHYHFKYSFVKSSKYLEEKTERHNRRKLKISLDEAVEKGAISRYEIKNLFENKIIVDQVISVWATRNFIMEQKAAGKRENDSRSFSGLPPKSAQIRQRNTPQRPADALLIHSPALSNNHSIVRK